MNNAQNYYNASERARYAARRKNLLSDYCNGRAKIERTKRTRGTTTRTRTSDKRGDAHDARIYLIIIAKEDRANETNTAQNYYNANEPSERGDAHSFFF